MINREDELLLGLPRGLTLALSEVVVGALLAIVIYFSLEQFKEAAAGIVASMGVVLGLHRFIQVHESRKTVEPIEQSLESNFADIDKVLDSIASRVGVDELFGIYNQIDDEFRADKNKIINDAKNQLRELWRTKKSAYLTTAKYYKWLIGILNRASFGDTIMAISSMQSTEWADTPEERNFFNGNLDAARKGCKVERIFIMRMGLLKEILDGELPGDANAVNASRVLRCHMKVGGAGITGRFVDVDRLKTEDPGLLEEVGDGFIMFNGRQSDRLDGTMIAMVDKFTDTGEARGYVTMNDDELRTLEDQFNDLRGMSSEFYIEDGKVLFS